VIHTTTRPGAQAPGFIMERETEMDSSLEIYASPGINWVSYAAFVRHTDGTASCLGHFRIHRDEQGHPESLSGGYDFIERDGREAYAVRLNRGDPIPLRNPGYVFGFADK